jgi:glycine dehydrogenase
MVSHLVHPQTLSVVQTRADSLGMTVDVEDVSQADFSSRQYAGVLFQYPDTNGDLHDFTDVVQRAHAEGVSVMHGLQPSIYNLFY